MRFSFLQKTAFGLGVFALGVLASLWLEDADRPLPMFSSADWAQAGIVAVPQAGTSRAMSQIFRELKEIRSDVSARPPVEVRPTLQP